MGLVQNPRQGLERSNHSSPITHTPCFIRSRSSVMKAVSTVGWRHDRTDMDGARFYLQDQTGKVLITSSGRNTICRRANLESWMDRHPGASLALAAGTAATDQELLQYIETAGVHRACRQVETGSRASDRSTIRTRAGTVSAAGDCPRHTDGGVGGANVRGNVRRIDRKLMAVARLADPVKSSRGRSFCSRFGRPARCLSRRNQSRYRRLGFPGFGSSGFGSATGSSAAVPLSLARIARFCPGRNTMSPEPA